MTEITRILCPIDFSDCSRHALDHAAALAEWYDARLTLLHVLEPFIVPDGPAPYVHPVAPLVDRAALETDIASFAGHLRDRNVPFDTVIADGPAAAAIAETAAALASDLIVIGTHGRGGFEHLLLGSVTERVIRHVPCATMIVPARAHDVVPEGPVRYRRILCAVDFSEHSIRAVEYAVTLAEEADAELRLLHVVTLSSELTELEPSFENLREEIETDRLRRLSALIPADAATYCSVHTALRQGIIHREIVAAAAVEPADLIVMGAQGKGAIDAAIFGSNTARVARAACCPVLVVH